MRKCCRTTLALGLALSSGSPMVMGARSASVDGVDARAVYEIRWSGLAIGEMEVALRDDGDRHEVGLETKTTGLIDWIFTYRSSLASSGQREQGRIVSRSFQAVRVLDDESESWSMHFDGDGALAGKTYSGSGHSRS